MREWVLGQMAMYNAYHRNIYNCATHFIGVPLILFSILIPFSFVQFTFISGFPITLSLLSVIIICSLYSFVKPLIGFLSIVTYMPLIIYAHKLSMSQDFSTLLFTALLCFISGWIFQFFGHFFEGRKPALMDNFLQIFMAPGFLVMEGIFSCGYMQSLKDELNKLSLKYI